MRPNRIAITCFILIASLFCITSNPGMTGEVKYAKAKTRHSEAAVKVIYGDDEDGTPREDQPEVVIKAPSKVKVGDMIVVDLSESIGSGFDMIISPVPPQVEQFGSKILTATGPKTVEYQFIVSCALNGQSDVKVHVVQVIGPQPIIPDDPGENIPQKVLSWCETVESPSPRDDALKLAQSFASLATVIENGTFDDAGQIVAATKTSNRDALGSNLDHWVPLLDGLMNELTAMAKAGMLPDAESHGPVWRAVSEGLKVYAEQLAG